MGPLSDDATVVRGGRNRPEDLARGLGLHPAGIVGVSVHAGDDVSLEELAEGIPNGQIGVTTVRVVRNLGGEVVPTSGHSPHHATLVGLNVEQMSRLLSPTQPNPSRSN